MSAGNLHPVEAYVVGDDLSVRHYHPLQHGLTTLRPGAGAGRGEPVAVVLTGIPWRTTWKYGERGWRHLWWDSGAVAANMLALAPDARVHLDFDDDAVSRLLGVDVPTEFPLAVITLGAVELEVPDDVEPVRLATPSLSHAPIEFPLVTEVQRATAEARGPLPVLRPKTTPNLGEETIEDLILRRGSTRLFRHEQVPEDALRRPVDVATDGAPLLEHLIAVHAVEGRDAAPRAVTQHLCYDQPLGGDSAYTVFHAADLDAVLADLGPRGYRAALFEAGLAAGRLQLAAFSLGLGATGLTFYDDEVKEVFSTNAACMLVTAVGVPDYRSRPGGSPGRPTPLTGFDHLMGRLQLRMTQGRSR
jgi:nitroreductase